MLRSCVVITLLVAAACQRGRCAPEPREPAAPAVFTGDVIPPLAQQGPPRRGGTLVVAMNAEPPSLNYQLDPLDAWGKKIDELVMESLARPDPVTWEHKPRLAESWQVSADGLSFTFHLRRGVRWHDGRRFTADDVLFTFDRILDTSSKTMSMRSYLKPISHVEKVDDNQVVFHLSRPYWAAFDAIAEVFIYPKHIYEGGDFNTHPANRAPVGTGRFRFQHWHPGEEISLVRNDDYFGRPAHVDRMVFRYVPDKTVRTQLLRRGDVHVLEKVSPTEWRALTSEPDSGDRFWRLRHLPGSLQWIGWNQERAMFRDKRVRRALTMLIDRPDIVNNLRLGLDTLAVSWFYPGTREHDAGIEPWPYAPARAADLLEEAGWRDSNGDGIRDRDGQPFRFTFLYPANLPFYPQLASLLRSDLGKAGIEVETARIEWAVFMERLRRHDFDACSLMWQLEPRNDPYQVWHSAEIQGGSNYISFRNLEADALMEEARRELDAGKRRELYRRFNRILHDEQPYTMLFNRYNLTLISREIAGIVSTPYGILSYADLFVREPARE